MIRASLLAALVTLSPAFASSASAQGAKPSRTAGKAQVGARAQAKAKQKASPSDTRHRAHLADRVLARARPEAKKNANATVPIVVAKSQAGQLVLGHGTGFFVTGADAQGRAVIMTNHHTMKGEQGQFAAIKVGGVTQQSKTRVLLSNKRLDYALLEVTLPQYAAFQKVELNSQGRAKNDSVYTVGYPSIGLLGSENIAGSAENWKKTSPPAVAGPVANPMLAQSDFLAKSPRVVAVGVDSLHEVHRESREKNTEYYNLPGAPGASGSPVFSRSNHSVVGLLYGASPSKGATGMAVATTPMHLILKHAKTQLRKLPAADRAQVQRMIDGAN